MPPGETLGRTLLVFGLILLVLGLVFTYGSRMFPWGRLPGDLVVRRGNFTFFFPWVSMLLVSLVLSLLFHIFWRR